MDDYIRTLGYWTKELKRVFAAVGASEPPAIPKTTKAETASLAV
jgi:hypothetical protein